MNLAIIGQVHFLPGMKLSYADFAHQQLQSHPVQELMVFLYVQYEKECKQKYPTRKIAASIESALHTAYSQQRLRGEWFNLTDADVAAIIETLK